MADAREKTTGQADGNSPQSGTARLAALLRNNVFPLLMGLAGAAGLVAVIGGITMWARFFAAELPPEQATDVVADPELIVIGAVALVLFVISGLLIVTFAYVIDPGGRQTEGTAWTLLALAVLGGLVVCVVAEENDSEKVALAIGVVILVGGFACLVLRRLEKDKDEDERERVPPTQNEMGDRTRGIEPKPPPVRFLLRRSGRVALAALAIGCALIVGDLLDKGSRQGRMMWIVGILLAVALMWACYAVADSSGATFVWYGLSLFVSVLLFGTYLALADVLLHQRLQPVAVIRDNDRAGQGVVGFYVAETDDRVYLATVAMGCEETRIRKDSGRLFWISRDDVRTMSIGPQQDPDLIVDAPAEMLRELWAARVPLGAKPSKGDPDTGRVGKAAEPDDELDPGDSPRAVDDLPEPAPAVLRAPKIHSVSAVNKKGRPVARARPGDVVTVKGEEFGSNPTVTVDDVRVGKLLPPRHDPHGNSEIKFRLPRLAETGRVHVRCGEVRSPSLAVVPRPVPVVVNVRRLSADTVRLAARPSRDRGELRYRWRFRGGRDKRQRTIVERIKAGRLLRVRLTLLDDEGSRGTTVVSVRLRDGRLVAKQRPLRR